MTKPYFEKNRLEAFSDGVLAIIITLLVLEIKVPHIEGEINSQSLVNSLSQLLPKFFSWALSFFMVLIMWVNHHKILSEVTYADNGLFWWNGLLLFFISFVPFPTAFIGDYFSQPVSTAFFGICLGLAGSSFYFLRKHLHKHPGLLKPEVDLSHYKKLLNKSLLSPILYFSGAGLAFVSIHISLVIYLVVPVYFIFFNTKKS